VNQVEDVLTLGQQLEVRVDDVDPQGKVSLSLAGEFESRGGGGSDGDARPHTAPRTASHVASSPSSTPSSSAAPSGPRARSFEESFEAQLATELGDLGPASQPLAEDDGNRRPRNPRRRR
jgi:polyribonucleotide nucleotidyltransferase